ncbi:hypothetical protein M8J77_007144 [Diaphorina citri]|nr:hypothetical protein M8J77_007144 [Diaphorina citri]
MKCTKGHNEYNVVHKNHKTNQGGRYYDQKNTETNCMHNEDNVDLLDGATKDGVCEFLIRLIAINLENSIDQTPGPDGQCRIIRLVTHAISVGQISRSVSTLNLGLSDHAQKVHPEA